MGPVSKLPVKDTRTARKRSAAFVAVRSACRRLTRRVGVNAVVAIFGLTLIGIAVGSVIVRSQTERQKTIDNAIRQNSNLALVFEEHTIRTLKGVDAVTLFLKRDFELRGAKIDIVKYLENSVVDGKLATVISVIDEHGRIVASTHPTAPVVLADREHFKVHVGQDSGALFISKPMVARTTGKWTVYMTRRINKPDGAFGGVVSMSVDPGYFSRFYEQTNLGARGFVNLVGLDGISRARQSGGVASFGQDMSTSTVIAERGKNPVGNFLSGGNIDGVRRYTSYRTVAGYPLVVAVGTAQDEVLAEFLQNRAHDFRWVVLFSAVIVCFSALLIVALGRQKRAVVALAASNTQFRATFEQAAVGISHTTLDRRFLLVNQKFCDMLGYTREELLAMRSNQIASADDQAPGTDNQRAVAGEIDTYAGEKRYLRKDGSAFWAYRTVSLARDEAGTPLYFIRVVEDITERKAAESALRTSEETLHATFSQAGVGIIITSPAQRYLQVNDKYCDMLGYTREELLAMSNTDVIYPENIGNVLDNRRRLISGELQNVDNERRLIRKDGALIWVHNSTSLARDLNGEPTHFITVVADISERKRAEEQLTHLAHHDSLTGLPNRELTYDRLGRSLEQAQRRQWIAGVMFVDLDRFKAVNDTLGHNAGDQVLRQVAERLAQCVRAEDTVGRLGGDEFAVILTQLARVEDAGHVAQKIIDVLGAPFVIEGREFFVTASVGIATYPGDADTAETLMKNADAAMYRIKGQGKNNFQFYAANMNERAAEWLQLEIDLRYAIQRNEFVLHYQPKADLGTGRVTGVEALLRWQRPDGRLVPPADFIPLLEESGLIVPAGAWILRAACAQIREWQQAALTPVPIAVNLSAKQFLQHDICAMVQGALREFDVAPRLLELEITESAAMHDAEAATATLRDLKALGVSIAIDDFGTGYSSLGYLKRFPIDSLKIDRSFVTDLPGNRGDASIAKAVITMAHALGLKVIAEGVENEAQREFLAANACDELQGYYFSRPLPAALCTQFLEADRQLPVLPAAGPRRKPRALAAAG
jgi:diguanylate cyclase (GGDEF)-like protein/PAS domain S-box-containing protein